jgi:hypothetical protein
MVAYLVSDEGARCLVAAPGTEGSVARGIEGLVALGAEGIVALGTEGLVALGTESLVAPETDGLVALGIEGLAALGIENNRNLDGMLDQYMIHKLIAYLGFHSAERNAARSSHV